VGEGQIIRLFHFRPIRPAFDRILRGVLIADLQTKPGLIDVVVGRHGPDELGARIVASVWSSRQAMITAVGETLDPPTPFHPELLVDTTDRELEIVSLEIAARAPVAAAPTILRLSRGRVVPGALAAYVDAAREGTDRDIRDGPVRFISAPPAPRRS